MKKLMIALAALAATAHALAMPTRAELSKAQPLVNELMAPALAEYKSAADKTAAAVKVGDSSCAFAAEAETEAAKFLLLKGAVSYYVRGEAYDKAADCIATMQSEIGNLTPDVVAEIVEKAKSRISEAKAPRLIAYYRAAKLQVRARKELPVLEKKLKRVKTEQLQRQYAEALAISGNWKAAYDAFAKSSNANLAKTVEAEAKGTAANEQAAELWWNYAPEFEGAGNFFKVHAVEFYQKALDKGEITGLRKPLAEKRVKEMEGVMTASRTAPRGSGALAASGKAPSNALYCVIDLSAGPTAGKYPVKWLAVPPAGGFNTDEYKTNKLVLRRIEPGKFMMGGKYEVTLTKPYYIGIFETTQKQYKQVTGSNCSRFNDDGRRPVESVSWNTIRGDSDTYNWPTSANVDPSSFMGKMQACTGLNFDLPTEAQWEYACRAGSDGEFGGTGRIDDMGWYKDNSGGRTHPVGQKQANAWGIHDMHGNVGEVCLDWKGDLLGGETDPVGSFSGSKRIWRGACWCESNPSLCGSSARCYSATPSSFGGHFGFRLCMNPEAPVGVPAQGSGAPADSNGAAERHLAKTPTPTTGPWAIPAKIKTHTIKLNDKVNIEFVECPAGTFTMGNEKGEHSPNREHKVTITRSFWIARTKLTIEQYKAYDRGFNPREDLVIDGDKSPLCATLLRGWPRRSTLRRRAEEYCQYLTKKFRNAIPRGYVFRLPSDAEWEYAYTAGETNPDDFYGMSDDARKRISKEELEKYMITSKYIKEYAAKVGKKCGGGYDETGVAVGKCKPNKWGLYDMAGNTFEMVLDTLDAKLLDTKTWYAGFGENQTALVYKDEEVDPLRYIPTDPVDDGKGLGLCKAVEMASRGGDGGKWHRTGFQSSFRLVVGPDLVAEKMAKNGKK